MIPLPPDPDVKEWTQKIGRQTIIFSRRKRTWRYVYELSEDDELQRLYFRIKRPKRHGKKAKVRPKEHTPSKIYLPPGHFRYWREHNGGKKSV